MSLADRFRDWRNNRLKSPKFQAWAARFPLTRGLARKRAAETFDLAAGFVYSQVLAACVGLDLFHRLESGARDLRALSDDTGMPEPGLERLVKAAIALKLLEKRSGGRFALGEIGAALLGNPSVFAMVRHHSALYSDLSDPVVLLRQRHTNTALARYWSYADPERRESAGTDEVAPYSELMAATQEMIAAEALAAYDISPHALLMDVGGGNGAFLSAAARAAPSLRLRLADLPPVADLARQRFESEGLTDRAEVVGLNMFENALPEGADLITLNRILHDHDDGPVQTLLASVARSLAPGGTLLVIEPLAQTKGAEAMGDAYFGLYLWAMGSGRPRTKTDLSGMLRAAGFTTIEEAKTRQTLLTRVLVARITG